MMKNKFSLLIGIFLSAVCTSFAQAVNDDCGNATVLTIQTDSTAVDMLYNDTQGAMPSGLNSGCYPKARDLWFRFTATGGAHLLGIANAFGGNQPANFFYEVYEGECTNLHLLHHSCIQNSAASPHLGDLIPGKEYFIRLGHPKDLVFGFRIRLSDLPLPPDNDICVKALVLPVVSGTVCSDPVVGSTEGAATSPTTGIVCQNCATLTDVWYQFTATQTVHNIVVGNIKNGIYNVNDRVFVSAYSGTCGNLVSLDRYTDIAGSGDILLNKLKAGETYYLRVADYHPKPPSLYANFITFNVCVTAPPPLPNENCTEALPLVVDTALYATQANEGALYGAAVAAKDCQGRPASNVWYQFKASSISHRIVLVLGNVRDTTFGFEVLDGTCAIAKALICEQGGEQLAATLAGLTVDSTYYVRVFYNGESLVSNFYLYIGTLPAPPANDGCAGALPLPINAELNCQEQARSSTLGALPSRKNCAGRGDTPDVWYTFAATGISQRLLLDAAPVLNSDWTFGYELFAGDCGDLRSILCREIGLQVDTLLGGLVLGERYYIRLYSRANSAHNFSLCLQTLPPPPANMDCAHAENMTSFAEPNCGMLVSGNTTGIINASAGQGLCTPGKALWYRFTAESEVHHIQVREVKELLGSGPSYGVETYAGDSCGGLVLLKCYNSPRDIYFENLNLGKTYYLRWVGAADQYQSFQLCLRHPLPPTNEDCATATTLYLWPDLDCRSPPSVTTAKATASSGNACFGGNDVWFTFLPAQSTQYVVLSNILNLDGTQFQGLNAELLTGNCGSLQSLRCWKDVKFSSGTLFIGDLVPEKVYYLRFADPDSTALRFDLCLLTPPPPPVNDACTSAIALTPSINRNGVAGSTRWATPTLGLPIPSCCGEGDVWYTFTATQSNQTVEMSGVYYESNWYPTTVGLELYAASCSDLVLLDKSQGYTGSRWPLSHLVPGTSYRLRIYSEHYPWTQFRLCIFPPNVPANDSCTQAAPLPLNSDLNCQTLAYIFTEGSTQSRPGCTGEAVNDIWYRFTATAPTYRFDAQWISGGTSENWVYELFSGDCGALVSLRCQGGNKLLDTLFERGLEVGKTYFLRFFSQRNQSVSFTFCTNALSVPPANDACANATTLAVAPSFACTAPQQGSTLAADRSEAACSGLNNHDVWYRFVATHEAHVLYLKTQKAYFGDKTWIGYQFFSGACGQLKPILCRETLSQDAYVLDKLKPGETYWVQVNSRDYSAHDFEICVAAVPPPPANDLCSNPDSIPVNQDLHCDMTVPGTTLGATLSVPNEWPARPDVWYTFTTTASTHFFQLVNIKTLWGKPNQLRYQLFLGDSCGDLRFIRYFEPPAQEQVDGFFEGTRYYLRVFSLDTSAAYTFDVCIKSFPPPPVNGSCGGALPLTVNQGALCTVSTRATTAGTIGELDLSSWYFRTFHAVWYHFVATSPSHYVRINNLRAVTGSHGGTFDVALYGGDSCTALTAKGTYSRPNSIHLTDLTPGQNLYIACTSKGDGFVNTVFHEFDICVTTDSIPANDTCAGAFDLPIAPDLGDAPFVKGTLLGASPSVLGPAFCAAASNDVWYAFVATQSAHAVWIKDALRQDGEAAYLSTGLYGGNCGNLEAIVCRGGLLGKDSLTYGDLTPGKTYFLQLSKYDASQPDYTFNIRVGSPPTPPANDACLVASPLSISPDTLCTTLVSGSTEHATPSVFREGSTSPQPISGDDVWYTFVATHASHWVGLRHQSLEPYPVYAEVYEGRCDSLAKTASFGAYYPQKNNYLLTNLQVGGTYYLRVFDTAPVGLNFDLCIGSPARPVNDDCAGAVSVPVQSGFACAQPTAIHTFGATSAVPGCFGEVASDVWLRFTSPGSAVRLWSEITGLQREALHGWELFEGDCGALKPLGKCWEVNHSGAEIIAGLKAGTRYYLRLYTPRHNWIALNVCLQQMPEPPSNDDCAKATVIVPNKEIRCEQVETGTTLGATQSAPGCYGESTHDVWYRFTATATAHLADLAIVGFPFGDTTIAIGLQAYSGQACTALDSAQCNIKGQRISMFLEHLTVGETYYLRVFNLKNTACNFSLCLRSLPPPPVNSVCSGAIEVNTSPDLNCTHPVSGNTANLSPGWNSTCLTGTSLWYKFTATHTPHFIVLQDTTNDYGEHRLGLEVYRGNCDSLILTECSDNGEPVYAYNNNLPGETYYIRVIGQVHAGNRFELCVLTPVPPANDDCPFVQEIAVSLAENCKTTVHGSTLGATYSQGIFCYGGPDVLYSFTAIATRHNIYIDNIYPNIPLNQTFVEVFSGDSCGAWHTYKGCYKAQYTELEDLIPGQTYYLRIGHRTWPPYFYFDLCITTPRPHLSVYNILLPFEGCKTNDHERIEVVNIQTNDQVVQAGSAEFRLVLRGANNGHYGPLFNANPFYNYPWAPRYVGVSVPRFEGVDMSALGETFITAIVTYRDGAYVAVDSMTIRHDNRPPYRLYCPQQEQFNDPKNAQDRSTEAAQTTGVFISPNPTNGPTAVFFDLDGEGPMFLSALDAAGRLVESARMAGKAGPNQYLLQTGNWPSGIYMVRLLAAGRVLTVRLAVAR